MKIGFICKYPPLTGGVASRTYWLTRALADRGHEIHIITNGNESGKDFKENLSNEDLDILTKQRNLNIHLTSLEDIPEIRPLYNPFDVKLANLALEVNEAHKLDVIDSWFLIPNSVAGFMVHQITGIPWVVRHGGSDLGRHLVSNHFKTLLGEILKKSGKIVTHTNNKEIFNSIGVPDDKIWFTTYSLVNRRYFNELVEPCKEVPRDKPVIMAIGKIGHQKGTYNLLEAFAPLKDKANLVFVTGGPGLEKLSRRCEEFGISSSVKVFPPVPPWRVASYIRAAAVIVHVERDFKIPHYPIIPREVMACRKCLLLSEEMYGKYPFLKKDKSVIVVDPFDRTSFTEKLDDLLSNPSLRETIETNACMVSEKIEDYKSYIESVENLYQGLIDKKIRGMA